MFWAGVVIAATAWMSPENALVTGQGAAASSSPSTETSFFSALSVVQPQIEGATVSEFQLQTILPKSAEFYTYNSASTNSGGGSFFFTWNRKNPVSLSAHPPLRTGPPIAIVDLSFARNNFPCAFSRFNGVASGGEGFVIGGEILKNKNRVFRKKTGGSYDRRIQVAKESVISKTVHIPAKRWNNYSGGIGRSSIEMVESSSYILKVKGIHGKIKLQHRQTALNYAKNGERGQRSGDMSSSRYSYQFGERGYSRSSFTTHSRYVVRFRSA